MSPELKSAMYIFLASLCRFIAKLLGWLELLVVLVLIMTLGWVIIWK
jgi:hypothetical protein